MEGGRKGGPFIMKLQERWALLPAPRGAQGKDYKLSAILNLIVAGYLCGRQNLRALFRFGRGLNREQRRALGVGLRASQHAVSRNADGDAAADRWRCAGRDAERDGPCGCQRRNPASSGD